MVSLVDIVPQKRVVQIAAGELELRGLGLRQIAELFMMFDSLRNIFTEGAPEISVGEIIGSAPDAIGMIIAMAAGEPEAAEKIVDVGSGLAPDELFECLDVVYDLTFPRGISPFLTRAIPFLGAILQRNAAAADPSHGDLDMNVPPGPSNSLLQDTIPAP